jgi:uncharacterized damage-inducible protein DinB
MMIIISGITQENKESYFVKDFLKVHSFTSDKVAQLADAIPAEKYDWHPAEGVRSVKEAIMHIAGANYYLASLLGTPVPEGIDPRNLEKSEESKEKLISILKESVTHIQSAIKNIKEDGFNQEVEFFGNKGTKRQLVIIAGDHVAEHLGQLIAYARTNGVVPPWSRVEN